jgi:uncharacterized protein
MKCNLCGTEFDEAAESCPGCGTETKILKERVQVPAARGAVNDFPGVLTESQVGELSSMLGAFFKQTDVPLVVAVVHSCEPLKPDEYAFLLYNHWGIGKKGVDRGMLVLLCLEQKHLESEIGRGLERFLPEEIGDEIVQKAFLPHFKEGNFFEGLKAGTKDLMEALLERLPTLT